jgi:hypothetical protein
MANGPRLPDVRCEERILLIDYYIHVVRQLHDALLRLREQTEGRQFRRLYEFCDKDVEAIAKYHRQLAAHMEEHDCTLEI